MHYTVQMKGLLQTLATSKKSYSQNFPLHNIKSLVSLHCLIGLESTNLLQELPEEVWQETYD